MFATRSVNLFSRRVRKQRRVGRTVLGDSIRDRRNDNLGGGQTMEMLLSAGNHHILEILKVFENIFFYFFHIDGPTVQGLRVSQRRALRRKRNSLWGYMGKKTVNSKSERLIL